MKRKPLCLLIAALIAPAPALAGNCGVGVGAGVGNPHCSGGPRVPHTNYAGVQPAQDPKPATQLGAIVPDHHNTVLAPVVVTGTVATVTGYGPVPTPADPATITGYAAVPPQPPAQQTPILVPTPTPPQVLPPQQTPHLVPQPTVPQPTPRQVPTPPPPIVQQTPHLVPQPTVPQPTPQQVPTPPRVLPPQQTPKLVVPPGFTTDQPLVRPIVVTGTQTTITGYALVPPQQQMTETQTASAAGSAAQVPSSAHQNALLVHAPNTPQPVTSGAHPVDGIYSFEFIEPGLQHRKVKVYRTRDAAEALYKDTIPLDQGGFQVIVIGTRNPSYVH